MRLNGETSSGEEEEEEKERKEKELGPTAYSISGGGGGGGVFAKQQKVVVGYALTSKKKKSFLQPKFTGLARNKGIFFVAIDLKKPLLEQGPFDVVLHQLSGKGWYEIIESSCFPHHESWIVEIGPSRIHRRLLTIAPRSNHP